jgi:hypothetical protein
MDPGSPVLSLLRVHLLWLPELALLPDGRELRRRHALRARAMSAVRPRRPLLERSALRRGSLPVALLALSIAAPARADLEDADRAYDEGRIADAQSAYDDALATGELAPPELARVHLRLGTIAGLDGDAEGVDRHFAIALAIDPALAAPPELSAALRSRFEALRGPATRVRVARDGAAHELSVEGAPAGLVLTVEARGTGWSRRFPWQGEPIRVSPPDGALPIEVLVLDPQGNRVAQSGAAAPVAPAPAENLLESPWLWVGVGAVVLALVGVLIGVSASGDRYVLGAPVIR